MAEQRRRAQRRLARQLTLDHMRFRTGVAVIVVAGVGAAAAVGYGVHDLLDDVQPLFQTDECTAKVSGRTVTLTPEQAENAALITAVSVSRGLPAHAATIALATAYQESKLYNLESGDRDSAGLFQQRPSQGWGSRAQVMDPYYATNAFYDALENVEGYEDMRVTEAAQEVQRSGFPEAYADHEADARVLASALTGYSPHAFTCRIEESPGTASGRLTDAGLTKRADVVRREVGDLFGEPPSRSTTDDGRSLAVTPTDTVHGWAMAQYLVAMAERLSIKSVAFDDRVWTAGSRSDDGWRGDDSGGRGLRVEVFA